MKAPLTVRLAAVRMCTKGVENGIQMVKIDRYIYDIFKFKRNLKKYLNLIPLMKFKCSVIYPSYKNYVCLVPLQAVYLYSLELQLTHSFLRSGKIHISGFSFINLFFHKGLNAYTY